VQEQLGFWQEYEHALNTVAQLVHQSQSTLDLVVNEQPATLHALLISQRYLQGVEEALNDDNSIGNLQVIAAKLKKDCPEDVHQQIDSSVQGLLTEWNIVIERLTEAKIRYSKAQECWQKVIHSKTEVEEWIRIVYPHVELGKPTETIVSKVREELPLYEQKMTELQNLATELCVTLCHGKESDTESRSQQLPLSLELEVLSRKLQFLRYILHPCIAL
jgi:hypothetical protein